MSRKKERVCVLGSGNWGSAIAKIVGTNTARSLDFHDEVNMWVHEETVDGKKLTDIINTQHENVKYLKGIRLPENVIAVPDLAKAAAGATLLIFVLPHQFVKDVCRQLRGLVDPSARAISLIKGLDASNGLTLISQVIRDNLQVDVSVLMGANVANDVANETFSETTIGYTDRATGELFAKLFHTPYFLVSIVNDVSGVELCGALKNIVAVAAGFVDGMGMGSNTKAAIMRIGMKEMKQFAETFYEGVQTQTFFESCGFADLITTCYGGRNARIAAEFVKTKKSLEELERLMLNGQKLQGPATAAEVHQFLKGRAMLDDFPLFTATYRVCFEGQAPETIFANLK